MGEGLELNGAEKGSPPYHLQRLSGQLRLSSKSTSTSTISNEGKEPWLMPYSGVT